MKNLIKAIQKEYANRLTEFTKEVNGLKKHADFNNWRFKDLLPKNKILTGTLAENKTYLIARKAVKIQKQLTEELKHIETVNNAPELISAKIQIEWNRNRTWGMCPTGEIWVTYKDNDGLHSEYFKTGGITGCGYDKLSTAAAKLLNQSNACLKPLYLIKDKNVKKTNREVIAYGAGYGILPSFEGGVGISCYPAIFDKVGYKFETQASGNTFDVFTITKK